jgi:small subunit ribosomal protein S9
MDAAATQYATGKRKVAIARAWVTPGAGQVVVNTRPLEQYFPSPTLRTIVQYPLEVAGLLGGALRHAIAKALVVMTPATREALKKEGLLTRDSRVKERKKYGQKGARKRFQYSKR